MGPTNLQVISSALLLSQMSIDRHVPSRPRKALVFPAKIPSFHLWGKKLLV